MSRAAPSVPSFLAAFLAAFLSACIAIPVGMRYPADAMPVTGWPASATCPTPARSASDAQVLLALINQERARTGAAALVLSPRLSALAHRQACDNAFRQSVSHDGSDGATLAMRLHRDGIRTFVAAENTGLGFDTPQIALDWWMGSPPHRENILRPEVTQIGIGQADGNPRPAWVLDFIQPRR